MSYLHVTLFIPFLLVLAGITYAHGLSTFGKWAPTYPDSTLTGTRPKLCLDQYSCSTIKKTTCINGKCLCGDNNLPDNGACPDILVSRPCTKKLHIPVDRATWFQAFLNCKNIGMDLASAETQEQSEAIDTYLDLFKTDGWSNGIWLSGTNYYNDPYSTEYYWLSTGKRVELENWVLGEPYNMEGTQNNLMWVSKYGKTGWAAQNGNETLRYLCESKDCSSCP